MSIMSAILMALMLAVIVEAIVEYGSTIWAMVEQKEHKKAVKQLCAIVLGVVFCIAANVDFFSEIGMTFYVPWIGVVLTGVFISRGANYASDIIKRLQGMSGGGSTLYNSYSMDAYATPIADDEDEEKF